MRTYPAYGRTIARHLVRGNRPACIGVLLSAKWRYFDRAAKICISPDEWALGRYEFGFLKNEHVVAIYGDGISPTEFGELLIELMLAGPRLLWVVGADSVWLYKHTPSDALFTYAEDLTKRQHHGLALRARDSYEDAQLRELGLLQREAERASQLGRTEVSFIARRNKELELAELLFSDPHATVDERAA